MADVEYAYICNNSGCPSSFIRFKNDDGGKCPFCGFDMVKNTEDVKMEEKTKITILDDK
ncbi:hypothetical protein LCGC14_0175490 [marine sediment metagenome]|uniref:Uncharacterized protein n=1 Tax=marine sediment metagenome TaxID=412755 RepID=A0A0F9URB2_9ZZZZ